MPPDDKNSIGVRNAEFRNEALGPDGLSAFGSRSPLNIRSTGEGEVFYRIEAVGREEKNSSSYWVVPEKQWNEWTKSGDFKHAESNLCLPLGSRSESGRYHVDKLTARAGCRVAEGQVGPAAEKNIIHGNFRPTEQALLSGPSGDIKKEPVATLDVSSNRMDPPEPRRKNQKDSIGKAPKDHEKFRGITDARDLRANANDNGPDREQN
tara:strand:+ start:89 stop:712 length:624 start_codon:yes stop_codon:yes gene_type:complete